MCGLRSESIQKKLLTVADLSLANAQKLSLGMEAAEKSAKSLKTKEPAVNKVSTKVCYLCGKTNHDQKECHFRDIDCHNCGKHGHIMKVCRSPKKSAKAHHHLPHPPRRTKRHSREHRPQRKYVTAEANSEPEDDEQLPLYTVGGTTPPIKVPMEIMISLFIWS